MRKQTPAAVYFNRKIKDRNIEIKRLNGRIDRLESFVRSGERHPDLFRDLDRLKQQKRRLQDECARYLNRIGR